MTKSSWIIEILLCLSFLSCVKPQTATAESITGFRRFIEGAAFDADGNFYAVNYSPTANNDDRGTIGKVYPNKTSSLYFTMPGGASNSQFNGIRIDRQGVLYVADKLNKRVVVVYPDKSYNITCSNDTMLQGFPNDLALSTTTSGLLFMSGMDFDAGKGQLWKCIDGKPTILEDNMGRTNGIALSPDDSILYVSESLGSYPAQGQRIWAYDVTPTGDISNKRMFYEFATATVDVDGMRPDTDGNLYVTRHGGTKVVRITPQGTEGETINLTFERPTNLDFGGVDGKTLYITGQCQGSEAGCIDSYTVSVAGKSFDYLHPQQTTTASPVEPTDATPASPAEPTADAPSDAPTASGMTQPPTTTAPTPTSAPQSTANILSSHVVLAILSSTLFLL